MKKSLKFKLAKGIAKELQRHGFSAYFVGGCVRDMLMQRTPKDIDLATDARPKQIEKIFPRQTYPLGAQFGTLLVVKNKIPFQISTFRNERGRYSLSLRKDIQLRDFTINGLAYEPLNEQIIDLVEAREDIRQKIIRTIGKASSRFIQDPLRLIRAVRFAVTLGFNIEQKTFQTIKKLAGLIQKVSAERIREELILIFTSSHPALGLKLLDETRLLKYVLPEVVKLKGVKQPQAFHPEGDVFTHTLLMLEKLKNPSLVLVWAVLLHDIGKPQTYEEADRIRFNRHDKVGAKISVQILQRLRFSNKDREEIVACVENHMRLMEAPKMREATLKRIFLRPTFEEELKLHRLDCIASHRDLTLWRFLTRRYQRFKKRPVIPKPLLNGFALKKMGFTPGPIFGTILKQMVDLQLEGKLKTKSAAKKWVLNKFKV